MVAQWFRVRVMVQRLEVWKHYRKCHVRCENILPGIGGFLPGSGGFLEVEGGLK